jgi:hypothetical protein
MTARGAILTPFTRTPARQEAGPDGVKLWWKRLLPVGEVKYQDRILKFTKSYNDSLVKAYQDGAYDQVPLQLADEKNTHTNDPERFRGDVVAMRSTSDGLWVGVLPTDRGDNVLAENPRLGVSARIVEGYDRSDGKFYPAAIQHVLGTLDPRIPQLGAWRAVSLSNEHVTTIDLTGESFMNGETITMPELSAEHSAKLARLLDLPEAQFSALVSGLQVPELTDDEIRQLAGEYDGGELSDEELAAMVAGLTDDELAAIEAEFEGELAGSASAAGLSNEAALALEMANYRTEQTATQLAQIMARNDASDFELEKRTLVHDLGLAPSVVDCARPLLEGAGHVVDLANGSAVDAGLVMRRVLNEVGRMGRMIDFGMELGSPMDEPEGTAQGVQARATVVDMFKRQTGLG